MCSPLLLSDNLTAKIQQLLISEVTTFISTIRI